MAVDALLEEFEAVGDDEYQSDEFAYWADEDVESVISKVHELREDQERQVENLPIFNKIYRSALYYYGEFNDEGDYGDTAIIPTGEYGQVLDFTSNFYRYLIRQLLTMVTSGRINYKVRAGNTDQRSRVQARLGRRILEFYREARGVNHVLREVAEDALVYGTGFVKVCWDPWAGEVKDAEPETGELYHEGDVVVRRLDFLDVVWEFDGKNEDDDLLWIACRTRVNKFQLMRRFPERAGEIYSHGLGDHSDEVESDRTDDLQKTDDVWVWDFYHLPTDSLPEGRHVHFIGEIDLIDQALPYRRLPILPLKASKIPRMLLGWSPGFDIQKQQEAYNEVIGKVLTVYDLLGLPLLWKSAGAHTPEASEFIGNVVFIDSESKPELVTLAHIEPEVFNFLKSLELDMEQKMGISNPVQGQAEGSVRANRMQLFAQEQSLRYHSPFQDAYHALFEQVGTAILELFQDYAQEERTIALIGESGANDLVTFSQGDIWDVTGVTVERGNPFTQTLGGKLELVDLLTRNNQPLPKEELVAILNGAPLEVMTEGVQGELDRVNWENEVLLKGGPHRALGTDNHILDIKKHVSLLSNPEARVDPELASHVLAAVLEHLQLYNDPVWFQTQIALGYATMPPAMLGAGGPAQEQSNGGGAQPPQQPGGGAQAENEPAREVQPV